MLSNIITNLNWAILKLLINEKISLTEISIKTGSTKANVHYALKKLEEFDLVRKEIKGRTHIFRFNFLNTQSKLFLKHYEYERRIQYNKKLNNIPNLVNIFCINALKENYQGSIFFGSSIDEKYNDIDVFILIKEKIKVYEIKNKLGLIDKKLSPLFGSLNELKNGLNKEDMLYKNISKGISFNICLYNLIYNKQIQRKKDINERYIIGYREILSCLEFKDDMYTKNHLQKGVIDLIYAILNYFGVYPKNDIEALNKFKEKLNNSKPKTIKQSIDLVKKYAWIL